MNAPTPSVRATHYEVSLVPRTHANGRWYTVHVQHHGHGRWVVYRESYAAVSAVLGQYCLAADGTWFIPDDPSWFGAPTYELEEALALAREAAPLVVVAGRSAIEEAQQPTA